MKHFRSSRNALRTFRRRLRFQQEPHPYLPNHSAGETPSLDKWSVRAAHWSQVAMLGLVGFGYFYTVRPVYQRDLLEEQTAKLQIEQKQLRQLNAQSASRLKRSEQDLSLLVNKRTELEAHIAQLEQKQLRSQSELKVLKRDSVLTKKELDRLASLNSTQDRQIVAGQLKIFKDTGSFGWLSDYLGGESRNVFIGAKPDVVTKWAGESTYQPIDILIRTIDIQLSSGNYFNLPEPHSISRSIILDFRRKVLGAKEQLTCPQIDRGSWVKAWKDTRAYNLTTVSNCVAMHIEHTAQEQGWTRAELAIWKISPQGKGFAASYQNACEVFSDYHADRLIADAYDKYYSPCSDRLLYAQEIVDGDLSQAKAFGTPIPPLPDPNWFSGWYKEKESR